MLKFVIESENILIQQQRGCTRSKAAGKIEVPAPNTKNLAVWNMAVTWNALPDLRVAKSEWKARKIVKKFVKSLPV